MKATTPIVGLMSGIQVAKRINENGGKNKTMQVMCALAYIPFFFLPLVFLLFSFSIGSKRYRYHAINATLFALGYVLMAFIVPVVILVPNGESFYSVVMQIVQAVYVVGCIYTMFKVYSDSAYKPFFAIGKAPPLP